MPCNLLYDMSMTWHNKRMNKPNQAHTHTKLKKNKTKKKNSMKKKKKEQRE